MTLEALQSRKDGVERCGQTPGQRGEEQVNLRVRGRVRLWIERLEPVEGIVSRSFLIES
jgi:hypothetical protein